MIGQSVPEDSPLIKRIYETRSEVDREDIVHCIKNQGECPGEEKKQLEERAKKIAAKDLELTKTQKHKNTAGSS